MFRKVFPAVAFLALFCTGVAFGSHFNPFGSSVDGSEIRWGGSTTYTDARNWANSSWNALNPIDILPDDAFSIEDLTWQDANVASSGWDGRWTQRIASDLIELNSAYLSGYTTNQRRSVATHELGHAVGLGDHSLSDFGSSSIIMYQCSTCSGVTTPQAHDQSDYNVLW